MHPSVNNIKTPQSSNKTSNLSIEDSTELKSIVNLLWGDNIECFTKVFIGGWFVFLFSLNYTIFDDISNFAGVKASNFRPMNRVLYSRKVVVRKKWQK